MEFIKAGLGLWVSRNNAYVILRVKRAEYRLLDGHSNILGTSTSLDGAKALADEHANN